MRWLQLSLLLLLPCQAAFSQSYGCEGSASLLTRVKDHLTPSLSKYDLDVLYQATVAGIHSCRFPPPEDKQLISELFYYRSLLADKLGNKAEVKSIQDEMASHHVQPFTPGYSNPLTAPPVPTVKIDESTSKVVHKWALVVGINQFQSPSASALSFAVKDATDFAKYLTDPKGGNFQSDRVKLLTNDKATYEGFREAFGWLRANAQPADLVVLYISSHGSPPEYDAHKVSYIILNDTKLDDSTKLYATSLQMIDLVNQINSQIIASRVVLFLDTCFSGDASSAGRAETGGSKRVSVGTTPDNTPATVAYSSALENLKMGVGRAVITASKSDEESFEDQKLHNGYFTGYLINTLRSGGATQTLGDIFPKVRDKVFNSVKDAHPGKTQTPSCEFSDRSSTIVLAVPDADSKVARAAGSPVE